MISDVDLRDWDHKPDDKNLVLKEGLYPYIPGNVGFPPGSAQTYGPCEGKAILSREQHEAIAKKMAEFKKQEQMTETIRTSVLNEANNIVNGARNKAYGSAEDNFQNIADLWNAYLQAAITTVDVANMMALMKIARLKHSPDHRDSWVDIAGYAACGAECGLKKKDKGTF